MPLMYSNIESINFLIFNFVLVGGLIYLIISVIKGWAFFRRTLPTAGAIFGIMTLYWLGSTTLMDSYNDLYPWAYSLLGISILALVFVLIRLRQIKRPISYLLMGLGIISLVFGPIAFQLHNQTVERTAATASTNKVGDGGVWGGVLPMLGSSSCEDRSLF
ncbi:MAG: hypothetical protein Q7S64_02795 [bacterium]|nr:hypothetical protein [bacterium]